MGGFCRDTAAVTASHSHSLSESLSAATTNKQKTQKMLRRRGGRGAGAPALRRAAGAVLAIAHGVVVVVGSVPGARALTASDWTRQGLGQVLFALGTRLPGAEVRGSAP